jgi:Ca2+-binding RTX toxin-like protein
MSTLTVGSGQQYSTIAAAVAASHDGDVVQVQAGTYTNDSFTVNTKITLQGVGGMVHIVSTGNLANDKGIIVTNTDVTIDHFELSGAQGPSGNDAGIRYQGGNLTLTNVYIHDNQDGLLANGVAGGTITIRNSEFAGNGIGDGYTHNLYVNNIAKLTIADSYFHDAVVGHEIKSRAQVTEITNTRIFDNGGSASYSIDAPNGGQLTVTGSTIQQGANSGNPAIIAFGEEGGVYAGSSITLSNNVVLNDMSGRGTMLYDASNTGGTVTGTQVWGLSDSQLLSGSGVSLSGTTRLAAEPALDTSHPWGSAGTSPPPPPTTSGASPIDGTAGADVIDAPSDQTGLIRGLDGDDRITGGLAHGQMNGNKGQDTLMGRSPVGDQLYGGQGNDLIDARASAGHNDINGNRENDVIFGGAGGDSLRGGQGDDQVTGGAGADWLSGDMGSNTLTGGGGADLFHATANAGVSVVTDFDGAAGDRVHLDAGVQYHLTQVGSDVHVVLDSGLGGELVLRQQAQSSVSGWILQG